MGQPSRPVAQMDSGGFEINGMAYCINGILLFNRSSLASIWNMYMIIQFVCIVAVIVLPCLIIYTCRLLMFTVYLP